ncbi:SIS domain-containing protein [Kitasatospora sp. NBC_01287]|uniref:SIS domain-containing protein n=1 Tax=Kitasatospora sp. NBC_01287 TaxID=2903573 RepID=UPI00225882BE|nr:SIS domain-containing protein [Kitasatospora sp. NBC_01287]MCX4750203.1 SIS domain-containing protein [Kitasatospora sp. NBC_01287]
MASTGSTALLRMILRQADALERVAEFDLSGQAATLAQARRVLVLGTGTSQHAAELGSMMLEQAGLDARPVSAVQWSRWGTGPRPGDALVVITHTAETAYAVRARAAARQAGIPFVSITGQGRGWPEAVETVAPEESETYTVSYTATLGVLALLAHRLGWAGGSPAELLRAADQVRAVRTAAEADRTPVPARSLAIIGCGPWGVTAREGALKIREAARMLCEGFDSDRFLHGSAVPYTAADGLLVLEPDADVDGLTAALGAAAQREGIPTTTFQAPRQDGVPLHPLLAQIPMTVRLQLLAERYAQLRGQDPDLAITGAWAQTSLWQIGLPSEPAA